MLISVLINMIEEEKELRRAFIRRWCGLDHGWYKEGYKEEMWKEILRQYNNGFKCAYCGIKMVIHGGKDSFSIEHKENNKSYDMSMDNLEIICTGCNLLKRSISQTNFLKIVQALVERYGSTFYEEVKKEVYEGIRRGLERAKREGKVCNRPRKEVDMEKVQNLLKEGMTIKEAAQREGVSYSTIMNRLREVK